MTTNIIRRSPSGTEQFKQHSQAGPPSPTDDRSKGFLQFSEWIDETAGQSYVCIADTVGAAVWVPAGIPGGGYNLIEDEGVPVLPQRTILNFVGDSVTVADIAGVTTATFASTELANAIRLGGNSADPGSTLDLPGPGTFWLGPHSTPPQIPNVQSSGSAYVAPVDMEIYGMATVQEAGIGVVPRTYQAFLNYGPIATAVQTRTPVSAGYVRIPDFAPVAVAAGQPITMSLTLLGGDTVVNPSVFLYARMP